MKNTDSPSSDVIRLVERSIMEKLTNIVDIAHSLRAGDGRDDRPGDW